MTLDDISKTLLNEGSSKTDLHRALDQFAKLCTDITKIEPDPSYTAWADDTFLNDGVAINPKAAAYCIKDYQRSVVFIRGVFAALQTLKASTKPQTATKVLYAGCGPFATLLLPLLHLFEPKDLDIHLLDIHQQSLDSVAQLIKALGLSEYQIQLIQADACTYQHAGLLDLIIVETMQKALEQEPQFAVTANIAKQLTAQGIFIPEEITVELALANLDEEMERYKTHGKIDGEQLIQAGKRHPISTLMTLSLTSATALSELAHGDEHVKSDHTHSNDNSKSTTEKRPALPLDTITIPDLPRLSSYQPLLFTRIAVYADHTLEDYASSLTLPSRCVDLEPLVAGKRYKASYVLGSYPKIEWSEVTLEN